MEGNPVLAHPGGVTPSLGKPVPDVPGSKEPKALVTEGWEEPGQGPRERLTGALEHGDSSPLSQFCSDPLTLSSESHIPGRPLVLGRQDGTVYRDAQCVPFSRASQTLLYI